MLEIGRLCIKIAGRDAGNKCVIVDILEKNYVLIDGLVRRRKCNMSHLEPMQEKIDIKKNASHEDIIKSFKKIGIEIKEKKNKSSSDNSANKNKPKKEKIVKQSMQEKAEKEAKKVKKSDQKGSGDSEIKKAKSPKKVKTSDKDVKKENSAKSEQSE